MSRDILTVWSSLCLFSVPAALEEDDDGGNKAPRKNNGK